MSIVPRKGARAFSLLEVVLALTVLAILAGTMFMIVQGTVRAASEVRIVQKENRQVKRFVRMLRRTFDSLPSTATFQVKIVEQNPLIQEITFRGAPEMFVWGEEPVIDTSTTLGLRRREDAPSDGEAPPFYVGMTRPDFFEVKLAKSESAVAAQDGQRVGEATSVEPDEKGRYWLKLLPEIKEMRWRVYDPKKKIWLEEQGASRPPLVEMIITPYSRPYPIRVVFAIQ